MLKIFTKGIFQENPIFQLLLGLCPTLAVTTSIENGIGMGLATTFVLLCSNILVSLLRKIIPNQIRIPAFIVIIATFVTIVELSMKAFFPDLYKQLGLFIPLIVVNCVILGRAEAFASKNSPFLSILDGLGMGCGFTLSLMLISAVRELFGSNKLLGLMIIPGFEPSTMMILPAGGFLTIGILFGIINLRKSQSK
jgi:electron transport complex protein RnfE